MSKRLPKGTVMIRGNDRNLRAVRVRYEEQKTRTTGGGTWATSGPSAGPSGSASGTFTVIGLIRFTVAPGSLPPGFIDNIGANANTRSGLAVLLIRYSDGSGGTLLVSCHQPVGSPSGIFEGITATKGFVAFHERVPPVPGVDANRTLFHVAP